MLPWIIGGAVTLLIGAIAASDDDESSSSSSSSSSYDEQQEIERKRKLALEREKNRKKEILKQEMRDYQERSKQYIYQKYKVKIECEQGSLMVMRSSESISIMPKFKNIRILSMGEKYNKLNMDLEKLERDIEKVSTAIKNLKKLKEDIK